jgi:aspartyl protease family protein
MALSSSGRKLMVEATACVAILALGAYALTHGKETRQLVSQLTGLRLQQKAPDAERVDTTSIARADPSTIASSGRRRVELAAGSNGHFFAEADINGRPIAVMVDTGASMVALTYDDARRAGIYPRDNEFTQRASTANGVARFAPVEIDRLSIGGVEVRNVRAAVMEDGKLETSLLGMSFLGKLGAVSMKSGRLVLEE